MKASFVIHGQPRPWMAPFHGRKGTFSDPDMKKYQKHVALSVHEQMMRQGIFSAWPTDAKLYVMSMRIYFKTNRFADATNIRKNIEDALQGLLFNNDRAVDHGPASRHLDRTNPRVELEIVVAER